MRLFLCFLTFIQVKSLAYNLCVVGASSGLGKELVYQTSLDRNKTVLALTTGSVIRTPCRVNSFTEIKNQPVYVNKKVTKDNYWNNLSGFDYENIIFTTSAKPFKEDYSDIDKTSVNNIFKIFELVFVKFHLSNINLQLPNHYQLFKKQIW